MDASLCDIQFQTNNNQILILYEIFDLFRGAIVPFETHTQLNTCLCACCTSILSSYAVIAGIVVPKIFDSRTPKKRVQECVCRK